MSHFVKRLLLTVLILALAYLLWMITPVLLMAFVSILIAIILRGLANLVCRYLPISATWALLVVIPVLLALAGLFFWFAGSRLSDQAAQFIEMIPSSQKRLEEFLQSSSWGRYLLSSTKTQLSADQGFQIFARITRTASTVFTIALDIILVLFAALFFSVNPDMYINGVLALTPKHKVARLREVLETTAHTLRYWFLGQAVAMLAVAILIASGLWLVGVPLALLLGMIAGLLNFIPFLGAIAGAVPGTLIALTQGWKTVLYAWLVYFVVQQLEGNIITPMAQKQAIEMPPALIILAVVAFGVLLGPLGVVVAAPLTVVGMVWIKKFYIEDVLGRTSG